MMALKLKKPQRSSIVIWTLFALLVVMVILSMALRRTTPELEVLEERAHPVFVQAVTPRAISDLVRIPGRIEPQQRAQLAVDKGGRVTELRADKGDAVQQGQTLLRIDDRIWRALLQQAEIELREAEKEYNRFTELARTGAISTSEFDHVRTRRDRARVQAEEARVHVAQCEVVSPADGILNDRFVEVGEFAPEGSAVFELIVSDPVKLAIDLPERDIGAIQAGDTIPYETAAHPGVVFTGTVSHIAVAAFPQNNSFRIEATTPNPGGLLRAGMIATATVQRAQRDQAIVVPLAAIIPRKGEHFVFVARDDNRTERRLVRIDRIVGDEVVLASGLEAGDELIIEGHRTLVDGARIERIAKE